MSPSERRSIYIPRHLIGVLDLRDEDGDMPDLSGRVAAILDRYAHLTLRPEVVPDLAEAEWSLILDACNGWASWASWAEASETLMTGLALEVADHVRLNDAGEKWGLGEEACEALVRRLTELAPAATLAVVERVERFWRRSGWPHDAGFVAARIHPTDRPDLAYEVTGETVRRVREPRFRLPMRPGAEGGWVGGEPDWLDTPPPDAGTLARWMREAGDAFAAVRAATRRNVSPKS